jgi:uncharacterized protein YdaU (DUF1376 family)
VNRAPAFQFYPDDWLSSPKISTMTPAEEGAYIRLLAYSWNDPDCTIPDDDTALALLSRLGEGWLNGGSDKLRTCFVPHPKKVGRLFNVRLMQERKKQEAWRKKSQQGGKRSAKSRALKSGDASRVVEGSLKGGSKMVEPNGNSSSSSSSSLNSYKEREDVSAGSAMNGRSASFELFWSAYPRKEGKGKCRTWWKRRKPDAALVRAMLAKIEQAKYTKKWKDDGGKYIPMPSTWLHEERWEDEFGTRPAACRPVEVVL